MRKILIGAGFALATTAVPMMPALAQNTSKQQAGNKAEKTSTTGPSPQGTPQRDPAKVPPGLAKQLLIPGKGWQNALDKYNGSNARWSDLPTSP